jgi:hypothetical protein
VSFLMVRGISDMPRPAGESEIRGTQERDAWKGRAAMAAARFTVSVIANGLPTPPAQEERPERASENEAGRPTIISIGGQQNNFSTVITTESSPPSQQSSVAPSSHTARERQLLSKTRSSASTHPRAADLAPLIAQLDAELRQGANAQSETVFAIWRSIQRIDEQIYKQVLRDMRDLDSLPAVSETARDRLNK